MNILGQVGCLPGEIYASAGRDVGQDQTGEVETGRRGRHAGRKEQGQYTVKDTEEMEGAEKM